MVLFSTGVTRDKLCVMYFLDTIGIEITRIQLTTIFLENNWIDYIELMTAIAELEEDGFIAAVPRAFGQCYRLTDRGNESLDLFKNSIPASIRERYDEYAAQNRSRLHEEPRLETHAERLPNGAIQVQARILENQRPLMSISFCVPDAASASHIEKTWRHKAEEVYKLIYSKLVMED